MMWSKRFGGLWPRTGSAGGPPLSRSEKLWPSSASSRICTLQKSDHVEGNASFQLAAGHPANAGRLPDRSFEYVGGPGVVRRLPDVGRARSRRAKTYRPLQDVLLHLCLVSFAPVPR